MVANYRSKQGQHRLYKYILMVFLGCVKLAHMQV
jgi:hypothetical protein